MLINYQLLTFILILPFNKKIQKVLMNAFKFLGSIPKLEYQVEEELRYFFKPSHDQNDLINQVFTESQENHWSNPQLVFENIINSLRKEHDITRKIERKVQNEEKMIFKIELKKPQFCMQAFSHTQSSLFRHGLDLNFVTPPVQQLRPFSSMFSSNKNSISLNGSEMDEQIEFSKIKQAQSKYFKNGKVSSFFEEIRQQQNKKLKQSAGNIFSGSNWMVDEISEIKSQLIQPLNQQKLNQVRAIQLGLIELNENQVSIVQAKDIDAQNLLNISIFSNFSLLNQIPQYEISSTWQKYSQGKNIKQMQNSISKKEMSQFQVSHEWHQNKISLLESAFSIQKDATYIISDKRLFVLIGQMLMGVENNLFWLDYDRCEWYVDLRGLRFQYVLRQSFVQIVQQLIKVANAVSRLRKFIQYVKQRNQRMIYYQISKVVAKTINSFQSYVLQLTQNSMQNWKEQNARQDEKQGFLQFIMDAEELYGEVRLLYEVLIWEEEIHKDGLSFMSFSYKFLRSQFEVFQRIMRLSRQADQLEPRISHLIRLLFQATFQPVLVSLNKILFQGATQITSKQDIYLKYYFQSVKQLLNQTSKKMAIIYKESPQLYLISKQKLNMGIFFHLEDLRTYDERWSQLFYYKFNGLQKILNQMVNTQKQVRNQIQRKRKLQLQMLKQKLMQKSLKQKSLLQQEKGKKNLQLQRLRKQIRQKEERNRLQALIQKQRQRGYLLQGELKNKIHLLKQKQRLLQQLPQSQIKAKDSQMEVQLDEKQIILQEQVQSKVQKKIKSYKGQILQIKSQQIMLPVVNSLPQVPLTSKEYIQHNLNEQRADQQMKQSQKEHRTKKIKKVSSNIRLKKYNKDNSQLFSFFNNRFSVNSLIKNQGDSQNFRQLCEKSKTLNFNLVSTQTQQQKQESKQQHQVSDESDYQQIQDNYFKNKDKNQHQIKRHSSTGTNAILDICIDKVIQNQVLVVTNCYEILIFQKYHLKDIIKFMKSIFLSENGQKQQNLLTVACNTKTNKIILKHFTQCSLLDNLPHFIQLLKPSFYHTRQQPINQPGMNVGQFIGINGYYGQMDLIGENLDGHIGFQFMNLPEILEPYFSYIILSKYMQIFTFLLRIKHCEMIVSQMWIVLNDFKKSLFKRPSANYINMRSQSSSFQSAYGYDQQYQNSLFENKLLNQLFVTRHLIQCFLKTYQNYIFFRVIEKEFKILNKKIDRHQLNDLQHSHGKVLQSIIRNAFVDNSTNNITKQIRGLLQLVRQFSNIVNLLCSNDIMQQQRQQIMSKVKFIHMHFKQNHKFFEALYFKT